MEFMADKCTEKDLLGHRAVLVDELESRLRKSMYIPPKHLKAIYNLVSYAYIHIRNPYDEPLMEECIELLATYLSNSD